MKLSELSSQPVLLQQALVRWITVAVALVISVIIAYWIGTQQINYLSMFGVPSVIALVTVWMRDRAWVLIPLGWVLTGSSGFIPMNFSIHDGCIMLAVCSYVGYRILSARDLREKWHPLDVIFMLNICWIGVTFLHNPVGLRVLGSETIGGRGYVNIGLALMAYWVMRRLPRNWKTYRYTPYLIAAGTVVVALINLVIYLAPALTPYVFSIYSGIDTTGFIFTTAASQAKITRWGSLSPFGMTMIFILAALYPPRTLFNPLRPRFYLAVLAFVCIFASGFRNSLLWAFVALGFGAWFHRGWREFFVGGLVSVLLVGLLIAGQGRAYELPLATQRALSWLPGQWSTDVVEETQRSSEGRFRWWQQIIREKMIHNWWIGDGFGVSLADYQTMLSSSDFETWMTLTGGYHNGPLTAVRVAGVVGLVLFYTLMISAAVLAVQCVNRCRGTPFQMFAIFLAIQLVWTPVHFTFVFGAYDKQVPETAFLVSLLLVLWRMREQYNPQEQPALPAVKTTPAFVRAAT